MEVEVMNLTAWFLAQKLRSLFGRHQGGKFGVPRALAESATDKRFLQSLKKNITQ